MPLQPFSKTVHQGTLGSGHSVVGRENAGWTSKTKKGHPCSYQNCLCWPSTEKSGKEFANSCPNDLPPSNDPVGRGTEMFPHFSTTTSHLYLLLFSFFQGTNKRSQPSNHESSTQPSELPPPHNKRRLQLTPIQSCIVLSFFSVFLVS